MKTNIKPQQQTPETAKTEELSFGKKALIKGWRSLTNLCGQDGVPPTGETMGKKMIWGIGGAMLAHFSGMRLIGSVITALAGMIFNENIKGMGTSIMDVFKGKINITDKKVLAPLIGGLAGFGLSAFGLKAGFMSSLLYGITSASITDRICGNQKARQATEQDTVGLSPENKQEQRTTEKGEDNTRQLKKNPRQAIGPDQRQTIPLPVHPPSDKKLLTMAKSTPDGLRQIRGAFPDTNSYNDFIARNGLQSELSRKNMDKFEGKHAITSHSPRYAESGQGMVPEAGKQSFRVGIS